MFKHVLGIIVLCISATAHAQSGQAPFCAVFSYGTQCLYYNAQSCRQAAGTQGVCTANPNGAQGQGYSGGYTGAVNDASLRVLQDAQTQQIQLQTLQMQQEQRLRVLQMLLAAPAQCMPILLNENVPHAQAEEICRNVQAKLQK